jgi:hypothetical protein
MPHDPLTRGLVLLLAGLAASILSVGSIATEAAAMDAETALRAHYTQFRTRLEMAPEGLHVAVDSAESQDRLQGDVYAIIRQPLASLRAAFQDPAHWCEALLLHVNVQYCRPVSVGTDTVLNIVLGQKTFESLSSGSHFEFLFTVGAAQPDYQGFSLTARRGPLGTSDYRIMLEALDLSDGRSVVHLRYAYSYGFLASLASRLYLQGSAGAKRGFTVTSAPGADKTTYIDGVRGIVERNAMRYYLALDTFLETQQTPEADRLRNSLTLWYDSTERYPIQLHELERGAYLDLKQRQYQRQQSLQ